MTADQLRKSILQQAIQGKLVPQDPNDEPASVLLERIREEKACLVKEKKAKREKTTSMIFRGEDNSYYEEFTATGEVKCIDDEVPFDLPESWCWVRFGEITRFSIGKTPERGNQAYWFNGQYPWVSISDMPATGVITRTKEWISQDAANKCFREIVPKGTLLMSFKLTIGRTSLLQMDAYHNEAIISIPLFVDFNDAFRNYLLHVLPIIANMGASKDAIKGKTLNSQSIHNLLLPLPPLSEQERIVAKIEELMPWVEQYGKAQSELDQLNNSIQGRLRKSILQYAIEGKLVPQQAEDGSAEELLAEIQAEKQRLYAAGKLKKKDLAHSTIFRAEDGKYYEQVGKTITCIDEEIPFAIPESWRWVRFGEITRFSIGKTPERGNQAYWFNGQYPWVAISDMPATGVITRTKEWISQDAASKCFREIVPKGTLLMSFKLTIGRTSLLQMDAYHNEAIISIPLFVDFNDAFRNYLLHVLPIIANMGASKDAIKGKTLNSQSIHNLLLPLPPLAEQQRIVSKLEEVISVLNRLGQ